MRLSWLTRSIWIRITYSSFSAVFVAWAFLSSARWRCSTFRVWCSDVCSSLRWRSRCSTSQTTLRTPIQPVRPLWVARLLAYWSKLWVHFLRQQNKNRCSWEVTLFLPRVPSFCLGQTFDQGRPWLGLNPEFQLFSWSASRSLALLSKAFRHRRPLLSWKTYTGSSFER